MPFQNVATLAFIACLVAADVASYLLNNHPGSELLWALNLNFANFFSPLLTIIDDYLAAGLAGNLAVLGLVSLLPLLALARNSRLPSAVYCHVSLATLTVLLFAYGPNRFLQVDVADNSGTAIAQMLPKGDWEGIFIIAVAIGLCAACIHAHLSMLGNAIAEIRSRNAATCAA